MNTPARANPIIAPLDNICGGAKPERSTPVKYVTFKFLWINLRALDAEYR